MRRRAPGRNLVQSIPVGYELGVVGLLLVADAIAVVLKPSFAKPGALRSFAGLAPLAL